MQLRARDLLLIPNILTLSRFALLFILVYLISLQDSRYTVYMLIVIAAGISTDILDGFFARKLGQISDLGKVLDPVVDKICTGVLVILLYIYSDFPLWAVILILARDLTVLIASIFFLKKSGVIATSNMIGRLAALSWGLVVLVYIIDWHPLELPMLWIATAMVFLSAISYGRRMVRLSTHPVEQSSRSKVGDS
jgi:CDP-diacylglycerol--glycerol-3-phosphate 3-phosphatidyltransferase